MRIVHLQAENVKRLRAVSITPDPDAPVVTISGENGEGKTSLLDSIAYALGGKRLICDEPIRKGQPSAFVEVDLGELVVRRTWTRGKESELEVRSATGTKMRSPQAILDVIAGRFTFDPLAFAKSAPPRQLEVLRELVGLDFREHDEKRRTLYEDRTDVGRALRQAEARLATMPVLDDVPLEEVSVAALTAELEVVLAEGAELDRKRAEAKVARAAQQQEQETSERLRQQIARLEAELQTSTQRGVDAGQRAEGLEDVSREALRPDPTPIRDRIQAAQEFNRRVRAMADRRRLEEDATELREKQSGMSLAIEKLDTRKRLEIEAAAFPVPGLALGDAGVTMNGLPFEQASEAERLRVSVAMGLAMNPTLRILLLRDGSGLDRRSERLVAEMAEAAGAQVWLETTKEGDGYLVISDGQVVA